MAYENNNDNNAERNNEIFYSKRLKAGKVRTYFFDVRSTRANDYFITLTESKKRFHDGGYDRHKLFLYKEDFNKFLKALGETIDHVKTELMPDFDFDVFNHENSEYDENYVPNHNSNPVVAQATSVPADPEIQTPTAETYSPPTDFTANTNLGDVDKW